MEKFSKFYREYGKEHYLYKIENVYLDTTKISKYESNNPIDEKSVYLIEVSDDTITFDTESKNNNRFVFSTDNGVFHLYVELTHPDLGNKYSINIVCPIDYN